MRRAECLFRARRFRFGAPEILLVVAAFVGSAPCAAAQTPVIPTPLTKGVAQKVTISVRGAASNSREHPVETLTREYLSGNWERFQGFAIELVRTLSCDPDFFDLRDGRVCDQTGRKGFDLDRDYTFVVWVGQDFSGRRTIYRALVRDARMQPYAATLPGVDERSHVYELFLSDEPSAEHASVYTFTPQADPRAAQVAGFVSAVTGPLFSSVGRLSSALQATHGIEPRTVPPPERHEITASLGRLTAPMKRARGRVSDVVHGPARLEALIQDARELATRLEFVDARNTVCAKELIESLFAATTLAASGDRCAKQGSSAAECLDSLDEKYRSTFGEVSGRCPAAIASDVRTENAARKAAERLGDAALKGEAERRLSAELAAMQQVEAKYRDLVASIQPERLTAESSFSNTPRTHWSFGALTSVAVHASSSRPRVKVGNDGKIVADPLDRQMTLAVVNVAPAGYEADGVHLTWAERVRPFIGFVLTPDFGAAAGISIAIWRGVGANAGVAMLAIPSLANGDELGRPPSQPNDPLGVARATAVFVGASYNFGGR